MLDVARCLQHHCGYRIMMLSCSKYRAGRIMMTNQNEKQLIAENPWLALPDISGAAYDAPYQARAAAGEDVHGEANAVQALQSTQPFRVLDAGCGTGRIAIELARRGIDIVGIDLDARMLNQARKQAP